MTKPQEATCVDVRRDGSPCQARALPGSDRCWAHDPELAEKRRTARRTGGLNSSGPSRVRRMLPSRLAGILGALEDALDEVHKGTLAPPKAQAMASLARAICAVFSGGELEERLRKLENALGAREEEAS